MNFKKYLEEKEQKTQKPKKEDSYLDSAMKWLKKKFNEKYTFKYTPNLNDVDKTYSCSIDNKEFTIAGKKYDTNGDDAIDTIAFKIIIDQDEEPEEPEEEEF